MAISAVSSISGGGLYPPHRARPAEGPLARVQAIPALAVDLARSEDTQREARPGDADPRLAALDPRGAESVLTPRADTRRADTRRAASSRLDELLGEKSAIEMRQAAAKGERSAEVVSQLSQLKARDSEVRAHEAAHVAAGGRYVTGGASYTYQRGPDGGQYAVGGEVGIDSSPVPGKPEETVQKMRTVRAAALAPSQPSGADLSVAAAAAQAEAEALAEISRARPEISRARPEISQARAEELAGRYGAGPGGDSPNISLDMVA